MIRRLTKEDYETYLGMAEAFYASEAVLSPIPSKYIENTFNEMMRSEEYAIGYALEQDHKMVGYALLAKTFSQEAGGFVLWLEELYVEEAYRGHGLGKEFFNYLQEMKGDSVTRLRLEVEEDNHKAIALYESMGFKQLEYGQMVKEFPY